MCSLTLYGYWRSTSSYRLRIALALKGVAPDQIPVHLVRDGGQQLKPAYRALNPQARVPALELDEGTVLIQSPAIIEYLEERFPSPPLLPTDLVARAKVRAVAAIIGCDIHPLHNVGPLTMLRNEFGCSETAVANWIARWVGDGLAAVEAMIPGGAFCFGSEPSLADAYVVPQLFAARRFGVPLTHLNKIGEVERAALTHPAFQAAHPNRQPDAETTVVT